MFFSNILSDYQGLFSNHLLKYELACDHLQRVRINLPPLALVFNPDKSGECFVPDFRNNNLN